MVKLSKRMRTVSNMVSQGNTLADIGTDHAYVPISLVQQGRVPHAIAMDINRGPLERANEHIAENNLSEYIETRLSSGVQKLSPGEVDSIVIAGMGGELIMQILLEGAAVCQSAKELILQPQSDVQKVRQFLRKHGYKFVDEDMVFEDGKYYPMMRVIPGKDDICWDKMEKEHVICCDIYGPLLLKGGHAILRKYLVKQHKQLCNILDTLEKQKSSEKIEKRILEIKEQIGYNESAYTILGVLKDAGI